MKKPIILLFLLTSGYTLADAAFGTYRGMTKEDLKKVGVPINLVIDSYFSTPSLKAPKENKYIKQYSYGLTEKQEVCAVIGETKTEIKYSDARSVFNTLKSLLTQKYGEPSIAKNESFEWDNPGEDIDLISLNLAKVSLDKTKIGDFYDISRNEYDSRLDDAATQLFVEKYIKDNNPNFAYNVLLKYKFKECTLSLQNNYLNKIKFNEESQGL